MADDDQQQDQDDQQDDDTQDQNLGDDDQQDNDDEPLGPKGEKALAAEKDKRRAAQAELREWKTLGLSAADIKKILDDRKDDGDKPDPERIRLEAKAEAQAELMQSRVLDKIEAKAARLFADPDDAAALLLRDHDADEFLDDGKIDVDAIQDALDGLLSKKPYLAAAQGGKRFQGSADGGTRKETRPSQLTRADLAQMSPDAIEKARTEGRLVDLMSGKHS